MACTLVQRPQSTPKIQYVCLSRIVCIIRCRKWLLPVQYSMLWLAATRVHRNASMWIGNAKWAPTSWYRYVIFRRSSGFRCNCEDYCWCDKATFCDGSSPLHVHRKCWLSPDVCRMSPKYIQNFVVHKAQSATLPPPAVSRRWHSCCS